MTTLLPEGGPRERVGFCLLLATVALAPILGGAPSGALYGQDPALYGLRIVVLLAALCLNAALTPAFGHPSPNTGRGGEKGLFLSLLPKLGEGWPKAGVRAVTWLLFGWTLLGLLIHSRFLTRPVLLFAMLPATLDWLCYALVFGLALRFGRDHKALVLLVVALVAGTCWVAIAGAQEYGQADERQYRVSATFLAPNFAAGFLALCLPPSAALFLVARSRIGTWVLCALAALAGGVLVATGSRVGLVAAAAGLGVAFVLAFAARVRFSWARVGALLAVLFLFGWAFREPMFSRVASDAGEQSHSGAFRTWTWKGTWRMAQANLLWGTGPGTFEFLYPRYTLVASTKHAHSSYGQLAAEQGMPAVALAGVVLAVAFAGGLRLARRDGNDAANSSATAHHLLLCGLYGGLVAGTIRSAFDSEWWLLGNALPFWTIAGLVAGGPTPPAPLPRKEGDILPRKGGGNEGDVRGDNSPPSFRGRGAGGVGLLVALALSLLGFFNTQARERATAQALAGEPAAAESAAIAARAWPPDPAVWALQGRLSGGVAAYAEAARVEPSGRRFYQLARLYEQQGQLADAVRAFEQARDAEPTNLQTLRALAQAQGQRGDKTGALVTWRALAALHEGPTGTIRAIPERPEIHPAWAYAALGDEAKQRGDAKAAAEHYRKAAAVVEDYADTTLPYQQQEVAFALQTSVNLAERRQQLRTLYEKAMEAWVVVEADQANQTAVAQLRERKANTLALLDKLATGLSQGQP